MQPPLAWRFSQVFGERAAGESVQDVDIVSSLEFDRNGDYLATGDYGGRIVLFERKDIKKKSSRKDLEASDYPAFLPPSYAYKTEFQSHGQEFDSLKSLEIKEKVNKIRWCAPAKNSQLILSTNNRTIKLWKVSEQKVKKVMDMVPKKAATSESTFLGEESFIYDQNQDRKSVLPSFKEIYAISDDNSARCRRTYARAHEYNIHSLSNNSDGETFISADDLYINLWNLEVSNQCFNIVNLKPPLMEDLVEVITTAEFHPVHCNILAYGSSRGFIRILDMRNSSRCEESTRILRSNHDHGPKNLFTEIIASISDIKFSRNGNHFLSRDYMNLKLWDLRKDVLPIYSYKIHEHLRPKLHELYNQDAVFDKFQCCLSNDGLRFAAGSYSNIFKVFNYNHGPEDGISLEATRNPNRSLSCPSSPRSPRLLPIRKSYNRRGPDSPATDVSKNNPLDLNTKVIQMAWHPTTNMIVCASLNSVYLYHA